MDVRGLDAGEQQGGREEERHGRLINRPCSGHRHAGCWQSQRSSVLLPACLQWSLQYFPWGPFGGTMHSQIGCAHFIGSDMTHLAYRLRLSHAALK